MKKKRFNEAQILGILQEGEAGMPIADLARKYGCSVSAYYQWKSKYDGMGLKEVKRLRQLEEENRRLKGMYATLSMDHELLKEVMEKKLGVDLSEET